MDTVRVLLLRSAGWRGRPGRRHKAEAREIGRLLLSARLRCANANCGIEGPNLNVRFGKRVSPNFGETVQQTLYNARRLWEVFSDRQDDVKHIPRSGLYMLAEVYQVGSARSSWRIFC
jgi:hypothetical protein